MGEGVKVPKTSELTLYNIMHSDCSNIVIMYAADSHASACSSYVVTFIVGIIGCWYGPEQVQPRSVHPLHCLYSCIYIAIGLGAEGAEGTEAPPIF